MKTLILNDEQHALIVSVLQGEICEVGQMVSDYNGSLSNLVSKEEIQEYLVQLEQLLKLAEA